MPGAVRISDAEWEVMKLLWASAPLSGNDVAAELERTHQWNPRTTKTLLNRLVKKKALKFAVEGKHYLYRPAVPQDYCTRKETESFIERVFGGALSPMLVHFVKDAKLSAQEIAELRRLLDEKEHRE